MQVATWNLWHGDELFGERIDMAASVLSGLECDVVLIQENRAWQGGSTAQYIASATGHRVTEGCFQMNGAATSGLAVLTREQPLSHLEARLSSDGTGALLGVQIETAMGRAMFASVHLSTGLRSESLRVREAAVLEQIAEQSGVGYVLVGGSFETVPDADSVRFLTGKTSLDGAGAFWIDAWDYVGEGSGYTIAPQNRVAEREKENRGVDRPDLVPPRREDFVLVRGSMYGEVGSPMNANLIGTGSAAASDHFGVLVSLL